MWISSKVFDRIVESNANLAQKVESLEYARKTMGKNIETLTKDTQGIEYGEAQLVYLGMGLRIPEKKTKSLTNIVRYLLDYLKLEITETEATDAVAKLVKIKPIKPKK